MLGLLIALRMFTRASRIALRDAEFRTLTLTVLMLLASGTLFYRNVEGWRWLDSLYFCVVTLATVGYGDLSPQTDAGKIFTMLYIVLGVGLVVAVVTKLAQAIVIARSAEGESVTESPRQS